MYFFLQKKFKKYYIVFTQYNVSILQLILAADASVDSKDTYSRHVRPRPDDQRCKKSKPSIPHPEKYIHDLSQNQYDCMKDKKIVGIDPNAVAERD